MQREREKRKLHIHEAAVSEVYLLQLGENFSNSIGNKILIGFFSGKL